MNLEFEKRIQKLRILELKQWGDPTLKGCLAA